MKLLFFLLGAFSLLAQTILAREFLSVFFGNEISVGLFYFSWLLFTGLGSALALKKKISAGGFSLVLWAVPGLFLLEILFIRSSKLFMDVTSFGGIVPFFQLAATSLVVNLPLPFALGYLFPAALEFIENRKKGGKAGPIFIFEALGTMTGGVLFTYLLIGRFTFVYLILFTVLCALAAELAFSYRFKLPRQQVFSIVLGLALAAAMFTPFPGFLESGLARLSLSEYKGEIIKIIDTRRQRLGLTEYQEQYTVYSNGKVSFSFPDYPDASILAGLLISQAKNPKNILLIGQGIGGLLSELLKFNPRRIDYLEPDPELFGLVKPYLDEATSSALRDERVKIHLMDGISYVRELPEETPSYDLIINFAGDPGNSQINRFYTLGFLKICRKHLSGKGVLVSSLTAAPNYLGEEVLSYNGSVYATLKQVFKKVLVLPGDESIFFATDSEAVLSPKVEEIKKRYRRYAPRPKERIAQSFGPLMEANRIEFLERALAGGDFRINTQISPTTFFFNMILWGRFSGSNLSDLLLYLSEYGAEVMVVWLVVSIFFWLRFLEKQSKTRDIGDIRKRYAVTTVGFVSFSLVMLIIYSFQSVIGLLFSSIAMISASYMLGMALSAFLVLKSDRKRSAFLLPFFIVLLMALIGLGEFFIRSNLGGITDPFWLETGYYLFAALAGAAGGPVFLLAIQGSPAAEEETTSYVHMLDALGASLGALLSGTLILPLAGFENSLIILLVLLSSSLVTLLVKPVFPRKSRVSSFGWPGLSHLLLTVLFFSFFLNLLVNKDRFPLKTRFDQTVVEKSLGAGAQTNHENFTCYTSAKQDKLMMATCAVEEGKVRGYAGPINIELVIDRLKILDANYLQSQETWSYIADIDSWLKKFKGKGFTTLAGLKEIDSIDSMTGATVTAQAVIKSIKGAIRRSSAQVFKQGWSEGKEESVWAPFRQTEALLLLLFLLLAVPVYHLDKPGWRKIYLLASIGFLGFYLNVPLTFVNIGKIFGLNLPGMINAVFWIELAILLVYLVFYGQLWCGYICPFGALQEFLSYLKPQNHHRQPLIGAPTRSLEKKARFVKYIILSLLLTLYLLTKGDDYLLFDPMLRVFSDSPFKGMGAWHYLVIFSLLSSIFYFRFYCRYLCPVGAILSLGNLISRIKKPLRNFSRCDLGIRDGAKDLDCIKCMRCRDEKDIERVNQRIFKTQPEEWKESNNIFRVFIFSGILLIGLAVWSGKSLLEEDRITGRKVDLHLIIKQIKTGKLSNHEALFYKKGKPIVIKNK